MGEQVLFYVLGALIIASAMMMVTSRNPITSAIFLVCNLFLIACLYAFLGAHFIATIQILVYAGAIMVLFLFVIMLLNLKPLELRAMRIPAGEVVAVIFSLCGFLGAAAFISTDAGSILIEPPTNANDSLNHLEALGQKLFTTYIWPFEAASFLILVAIIATVVIGKKEHILHPPKKGI